MTKRFGRYQAHNRHWGPADSFISVENDRCCRKSLRFAPIALIARGDVEAVQVVEAAWSVPRFLTV
jgi:hypothetical protein